MDNNVAITLAEGIMELIIKTSRETGSRLVVLTTIKETAINIAKHQAAKSG